MRLLLRLARDIIMINKNSGKHFARIPTALLQSAYYCKVLIIVIGPKITEMDMLSL